MAELNTNDSTSRGHFPAQPSTSSMTETPSNAKQSGDRINEITLTIPRAISSKKNCIICGESKKLIPIPNSAFLNTFIESNILIPSESKCCAKHLNKNDTFLKKCLNRIEIVSDQTTLKGEEIEVLLASLRHTSKYTLFEKFSKRKTIKNDECLRYTGLNKDQFNELFCGLKTLNDSQGRTKSQALATYLFWLKTGLDQATIASLFSINNQQTVSEYCSQVRKSLLKDFVPNHLGVSHLTREQWTQQTTITAKILYDVPSDRVVLVADGTYLYQNKSADNEIQRKSYSVQKSRHLSKPFIICTTTGKIVDVYGLYPATMNDATILDNILKCNKDLRKLLGQNDHIILDRGFRNVIDTLKNNYKLITHMPTCKTGTQEQLSTLEANESRLTTRTRWIVESINSKLKNQFRANGKVQSNLSMSHAIDDWRIAAALTNRFHFNYQPNENEYNIAMKMKTKSNRINTLESILSQNNLDRKRKDFKKMTVDSVRDFPKLSLTDIIDNITFSEYQIKQAHSYIKENFKEENNPVIEILAENTNIFNDNNTVLLRSRIQSRHVNSKQYLTYIAYDKTVTDYSSIKETICSCNAGKRTVGSCAHATSVMLYLGNTRYNSTKKSRFTLDTIYSRQVPSESSSSDSENTFIASSDSEIFVESDHTIIDETYHGETQTSASFHQASSSMSSTLE